MTEFRDRFVRDELGLDLHVEISEEGVAEGINPFDHGAAYTEIMRTKPLKKALTEGKFDAAIGGGRRDEERFAGEGANFFISRPAASLGSSEPASGVYGTSTNTWRKSGECIRVFPLSNWTETRCLAIHRFRTNPNCSFVPGQGATGG